MSIAAVVNVSEVIAGSELLADAAAASTTITVEDPTDFAPDGGTVLIGGTESKEFSTVDEVTGVITLDAGLTGSFLAGDRVEVVPQMIERFAHVFLAEQEETLTALVPHALYDRLPLGARDQSLNEAELVELGHSASGELIVADVPSRQPFVDGSFIDPGTLPPPDISDGSPPGVSPPPTVLGGVNSLFVTWSAISNPDPVTYEVHVSTSSGFTPGAGTLAGEIRGTIFVIRDLPGAPVAPAYGTTYFVKIVAKDDDGAAAASTEASGTPAQIDSPDITANAVTAVHILAEAITAEKLESVLVLGSTIVAGTLGSSRVELGFATADASSIGILAFDEDGTTVTFEVDAETGQVYLRGRVDWGTASRLLSNDIIEIAKQPASGFETPQRVQSRGSASSTGGTYSAATQTLSAPSVAGSLVVAILDFSGPSLPSTPTTPAGFTKRAETTQGKSRLVIYDRANCPSITSLTVTFGATKPNHVGMELVEVSGIHPTSAADSGAVGTNQAASGQPTVTGDAALDQSTEYLLTAVATSDDAFDGTNPSCALPNASDPGNGWGLFHVFGAPPAIAYNLAMHLTDQVVTGSVAPSYTSTSTSSPINGPWLAAQVRYKAAPVAVIAPDTGKLRLFASDDGVGNIGARIVLPDSLDFSIPYRGRAAFANAWQAGSDLTSPVNAIGNGDPVGGELVATFSGTAAGIVQAAGEDDHPGIARCDCGTANGSGWSYIASGRLDDWAFSNGKVHLGALVRLATLSVPTQRIQVFVGFADSRTGIDNVAGNAHGVLGFRYSDNINPATAPNKWQAIIGDSAGGSASADSGVQVNAGQWYKLDVVYDPAVPEARFYVDGALVHTASSPGLPARIGVQAGHEKLVGAASRMLDVDYLFAYGRLGR